MTAPETAGLPSGCRRDCFAAFTRRALRGGHFAVAATPPTNQLP